jgi:D-alanyl-lipoteichoic acid acyltransferase DltB (MBOAT superfamily)
MLFNSIEYLLFFPAVLLIYYLLPGKVRLYFLLACSYLFYMCWDAKYALLLLFSTAVTFISGLMIGRAREKRGKKGKGWVVFSAVINLSILFFFKYFNFTLNNINTVLDWLGKPALHPSFDVQLPVGISFYIFQALSYTFDVYRQDVRTEKNFFKYAVFVSFFPQLVAGPIERSSHLLGQFDTPHAFKMENLTSGLLKMLWGFFLKIVIADRAALLVNQVFLFHSYYSGFEVIIAVMLFALQIYGDFAGYSWIAVGTAQTLGFSLCSNFNQPYFAVSVADFWRRWRISLSTWFRDYLYIPLGGNRRGKARQYLNIMIVFACSGLWHGAAWTYVIWGLLNACTRWWAPPQAEAGKAHEGRAYAHGFLQPSAAAVHYRVYFRGYRLDLLPGRHPGGSAGYRAQHVRVQPLGAGGRQSAGHGLNSQEWTVLLLSIAGLPGVSVMKEKGVAPIRWLFEQEAWFRWGVCIAAVLAILAVGLYGPGFNASAFIYFQF